MAIGGRRYVLSDHVGTEFLEAEPKNKLLDRRLVSPKELGDQIRGLNEDE